MRWIPLLLSILLFAGSAHAANIVIVNLDGTNEGFNDTTPATPVGGNPGTTIGQQRLNLFTEAANIWGALLPSGVTIRVRAQFNALTCDATTAVLGSAGPVEVQRDFTGAEFPATWYHAALANKQAGSDLSGQDDISATFNSSVDNNESCLSGTNWYYGFDGNEGGDIELLPVLLHEMGHGLGFSTLLGSNGREFLGFSDVYETFILDTTTGLHWDEMTDGQRAASAVNTGNVVWDGFATTFSAPYFLGATPTMFVNSPVSLPASFGINTASFGPGLPEAGITGDLVLVSDGVGVDTDACSAIINAAQVVGRIALIDRGTCTFASKALEAEAAGALAVVIANNVEGNLAPGGTAPGLTIPVVAISLADANLIKAELLGGPVNVTVGFDPAVLAGADPGGRVKLYTPDPYEGGSSVSHWDTSASPSLLMEPAITSILSSDVDLTLKHFEDIGWLDARLTASPELVLSSALLQNVPNPFNPVTTISFSLYRDGPASIEIFDVAGRRVKTLLRQDLSAGDHHVIWNGRDDAGRTAASGVYVYRLKTADMESSRRMLLLK